MDLFGKIRVRRIRKRVGFAEQYSDFKIGPNTYGAPRVIGEGKIATLEIGSYCSISEEVTIFLDAEHRPDWVTTYPFNVLWPECIRFRGHPSTKGNVIIGHDVWLGYGSTVLSGVSIGTGAVVGAKSVVTSDVPPYAIVAGNPARVLRFRFDEAVIARMLASKWWDLPRERLLIVMPLLMSDDVEKFLATIDGQ